MKFWFGKNESVAEAQDAAVCDVLAEAQKAKEESASPVATVPPPPPPVPAAVTPPAVPVSRPAPFIIHKSDLISHSAMIHKSAEIHKSANVPPAPLPEPAEQKIAIPTLRSTAKNSPFAQPKPLAFEEPKAPVPGQPLLKAIPVTPPQAHHVMTLRPAAPAAAPAQPAAPAFGFRPKTAAAPVALAPTAATNPAGAATDAEPAPPVRPKADQKALYYQLMNGLYDAILILDDQGHVVDCNERIKSVLGYERDDAWDLPVDKIITGLSAQLLGHIKRNLAENHHILMDAKCFRRDGSSFAGEVGVSTITLTSGLNMVLAIRNVDRRRAAINDLKRFQAAMDIALTPAFVCDIDGFFLMGNRALMESFGFQNGEQLHKARFMDVLSAGDKLFLRASCGEKIRQKIQLPIEGGSAVTLDIALSPILSGSNNEVSAVAGSILQTA